MACPGQCPWTLSGHCPWTRCTLSMDKGGLSMDNVHLVHGQCPDNVHGHCTGQAIFIFPQNFTHSFEYNSFYSAYAHTIRKLN